MKYAIRKKISNSDRLFISQIREHILSRRIENMIRNKERQYNEKLDLYYVVTDVYTFENFAEECLEVRIVIEIDTYSIGMKEDQIDMEELFLSTFTN